MPANGHRTRTDEPQYLVADYPQVPFGPVGIRLGLFLSPVALVILAFSAWAVDSVVTRDTVARNVELAGLPVGGSGQAAVAGKLDNLADQFAARPVEIRVDDVLLQGSTADFGLAMETESTLQATLDVGRTGNPIRDAISWWEGWLEPRQVEPTFRIDRTVGEAYLASLPGSILITPREPSIIYRDGELVAKPGSSGLMVDIPQAIDNVYGAVTTEGVATAADTVALIPAVADKTAFELATQLNATTKNGLTATVADQTLVVDPLTLRSFYQVHVADAGLQVTVNSDGLFRFVETQLVEFTTGGTDPKLKVSKGKVSVVEPGQPPMQCCALETTALLEQAALAGDGKPVELILRPTDDPDLVAWAAGEGVVEKVSSFTTRHACCESRVSNIHRMADLIRGVVLYPGESFSINKFVGKRTRAKGFVAGGAISQGRFVQDVGGGVSQFATTMFNASFFAGLDFDKYQSHSIYISRYPYGREATLGYPNPDLAVTNNTDYPVLVWTSYSGNSITVSMWSTKHVDVQQTGQSTSYSSRCRVVTTYRTRKFPGGRVIKDSVFAVYRPAEGLDCNGRATPQT